MTHLSGSPAGRLLATKLRAPRRRPTLVPRDRLVDRLSHDARLTLVSAPAGFGKTTLLADWLDRPQRSGGSSVAWVALDEHDDDPAAFGSYVAAAVSESGAVPGGDVAAARGEGSGVDVVMRALVHDLATTGAAVTLVLDDYHSITSPEIHDAVRFLVEYAPDHFRLVVATRADPPWPLSRWRARGDLLALRAADLRFTPEEAGQYLTGAMALRLSDRDVRVLSDRTEGWIAALQLAALSLDGRDDVSASAFIDDFGGDDRFVVDFLADEVLERLPDPIRDFLRQTSVLDRMTGPLCDALTGATTGTGMLESLERSNLFVIALDDRRRWYRYHHLFADVLRARSAHEHPERVAELHVRASEWFEGAGEAPESIRHAIAAGDVLRVARLVEQAAPMMRRTRQEALLRRWLEHLPEDVFGDRPVLAVALVGARMATGDSTGAGRLLDSAERWIADAPGSPSAVPIVADHDEFDALPAQIAVYRAALALLDGDTAATIDHAERVLQVASRDDHVRRGAAHALIGLASWARGDLPAARQRYADAVTCFTTVGFVSDVLGCSLALGDIQIAMGRLGDARRTYEQALDLAAERGVVRGTADMHVGLAEVHLDRHELDSADDRVRAAERLGEDAGLPQHPYRWRVAAARLHAARGDLGRARELLGEAASRYDTDFSPRVRPVAATIARLELAAGRVVAASAWAEEAGCSIEDELSYVREYEHVTLARTLLARPDSTGEAVAFLERLLDAAEAGDRRGAAAEILTLLACGRRTLGDRAAARTALRRALQLAEDEGYVRVFLDAGARIVPALQDIVANGDGVPHARFVLALASAADDGPRPVANPLVVGLSSRELDVLRLLRSDMSGPEIARTLHVSVNTLRTHTKSIYTKLGVTSRREALSRAAEHGL